MNGSSGPSHGPYGALVLAVLLRSVAATGAMVASLAAQQPAPAASTAPAAAVPVLVFAGVTVVDVTDGTLHSEQTVVITGPRITALGPARTVRVPGGARVVDARGQYLIPGLWDMHTHLAAITRPEYQDSVLGYLHALLIGNGVTGIRDAGTGVPLDSLVRWRRAILAGQRVGPPRQLLAGPHLEQGPWSGLIHQLPVNSMADVRHAIDSLLAAGADHIKLHDLEPSLHDSAVTELRQRRVLFGGHMGSVDTGARFVDHDSYYNPTEADRLSGNCSYSTATLARCRPVAERMRRNDMWFVPCPMGSAGVAVYHVFHRLSPGQRQSTGLPAQPQPRLADAKGMYVLLARAGVPLVTGTDGQVGMEGNWMVGATLQDALADLVWAGLTPLEALQAATLNPAKALHATDSLGTVAEGKLADLVLLEENPLADITNTAAIRAVVANGRYFDRAALDALLAGVNYDLLTPAGCEGASTRPCKK